MTELNAVLPVLLGQRRASSSKRMSLSTLIERAWILKMCVRPWNKPIEIRGAKSQKRACEFSGNAHLQVGQAELDLPVQTAGPHEGRVQGVWSVGGHQYLDVATRVETVQLVDELQHRPLHLVVSASAVVETRTWVRSKVTVSTQMNCWWTANINYTNLNELILNYSSFLQFVLEKQDRYFIHNQLVGHNLKTSPLRALIKAAMLSFGKPNTIFLSISNTTFSKMESTQAL